MESMVTKCVVGCGAARRDTMEEMTTTPRVLDGVAIAAEIKAEVGTEVQQLAARGIVPGLAVILVGEVPASQIYVRSKVKTCGELGIYSEMLTPDASITTDEMLALVAGLNAREDIDGILIQLPLPKHVDTKRLLEAVSPDKDVDGFHPVNAGRLQSGQPGLTPCTPAGIIEILKRSKLPITGQNAVIVGRSDIVGKPAAMMLLNESATVTVCHSKTRDLPKFTREADLLVAAIGRPGYVTAEMVKPGATLIDVGINRVTDAAEVENFFPGDAVRAATFAKRGSVVVGDIHPAAFARSGAFTPVPGGVGALTIAMLMHNTVKAAKLRRGISTGKS
jgi:methylenetetrahydrofolate dehydrogenase (NADP+)/methenyltetrahydrofolate cyclohydrolase